MKIMIYGLLTGAFFFCGMEPGFTQEQTGVTVNADRAVVSPEGGYTNNQVKAVIEEYIKSEMIEAGVFDVYDPDKEETRELKFEKVHADAGRSQGYYFACADFTDQATGDKIDLDFDVEPYEGQLEIVDVRIHKVNGIPRFAYDRDNNRVPIIEESEAGMKDISDTKAIEGISDKVSDAVTGVVGQADDAANQVVVPADPAITK